MKCRICGREFSERIYMKPYHDLCSSKCFSTNLWNARADEYELDDSDCIVIKGVMYSDGGESDLPSSMKGFSGRKFKIQMNDGEIIETDNLWCGGAIPDSHRDRMPDNAKFIDSK